MEGIEAYLKEYPNGKYADEVRKSIDGVREKAAYKKAYDVPGIEAYLKKLPDGRRRTELKKNLEELYYARINNQYGLVYGYWLVDSHWSNWDVAERVIRIQQASSYLKRFPNGKYADEIKNHDFFLITRKQVETKPSGFFSTTKEKQTKFKYVNGYVDISLDTTFAVEKGLEEVIYPSTEGYFNYYDLSHKGVKIPKIYAKPCAVGGHNQYIVSKVYAYYSDKHESFTYNNGRIVKFSRYDKYPRGWKSESADYHYRTDGFLDKISGYKEYYIRGEKFKSSTGPFYREFEYDKFGNVIKLTKKEVNGDKVTTYLSYDRFRILDNGDIFKVK